LVCKGATVDGQNILYHYLQKSILLENSDFSKELIKRLLVDLSIWIPPTFYKKMPIILPYAVRDRSCRKKGLDGKDEWGKADEKGFLRDDNTLIKCVVRSFPINSSRINTYDGKKLGTGFVASHIWGKVTLDDRTFNSSRHYLFNSFVPNIVWLPAQIAKLTDREGSYSQQLLKAISYKIYRQIALPLELDKIWNTLLCPNDLSQINIDLKEINFFSVTDDWLRKRISLLKSEMDTILGQPVRDSVKCSNYLPSLQEISPNRKKELSDWLMAYNNWLRI